MESHEILKRAMKQTSPKAVAADLGVSLSLVYKWAEMPNLDGSGSRNPLDRLQRIIELSGDRRIVEWLCRNNGGHFLANPEAGDQDYRELLPAIREIISQFSDVLNHVSHAAVDHRITREETRDIRETWDKLKSYAEGFVRCCEAGNFDEMFEIPKPSQGPDRLRVDPADHSTSTSR